MNGTTNQAFDPSPIVLKVYSESTEKVTIVNNNSASAQVPAVEIKNAYKSYGRGKKKRPIMFNLNMNVKQGTM